MKKKWNAIELIAAVDAYLDGKGIKRAAKLCNRNVEAVENVIKSDLPRNYRNCINWMKVEGSVNHRRIDCPFTITEDKYLLKLFRKERSNKHIEVILGRPMSQVLTRLGQIQAQQTSEGFIK